MEKSREVTKQADAVRRLRALALRLGPGEQMPKFVALRQELGVSGTTLIAALDDLERQGMIVRRHGVGIYVSPRLHHRNVVLLCDPVFFEGEGSPFWEMLVRHARTRAAEKSEDLVLHFIRYDGAACDRLPEPLRTELDAQRVHGVLGVGLPGETVQAILERALPLVAFAGYAPCAVAFRDESVVRLGVAALAACGCRRIGLWSSVPSHRPICRAEALARPALAAFQEALARADLPFDPSLVRTNTHLCPDTLTPPVTLPVAQEQGRLTAEAVFGPDADPRLRPDGIVCTEDSLLQGALPQLALLHVRPGPDLRIATHANAGSPTLFGYDAALIRMEMRPAQLVGEMYALLEDQMQGRVPETPLRYLEPALILPPDLAG